MSSDAFRLENIQARYGDRLALDVPEMVIPSARVVALMGPNGSGKTTLLHVLAFLKRPTDGRVLFFGATEMERRRVGVVLQDPYLFRGTVRRNIELAGPSARVMERFGLAGMADRDAKGLSSGERMRVALARALAREPDVLLLDECTTGLDEEHRGIFGSVLREDRSRTVVFATHDRAFAFKHADDVIALREGRPVPANVENLLRGEVRDGMFEHSPGLRLSVVGAKNGPAVASIAPEEILLSAIEISSSARNSLPGRVTGLEEWGDQVRVTVDVGAPLVSVVTRASYVKMDLRIGSAVHATFKASAVKVQ